MTKRKKPEKRQEDDRLDDVQRALEQFDVRALPGTYKMDPVINRLVIKHGEFCASSNEAFRRHIHRAGLTGLHAKSSETLFQFAEQSGANLLQKLQQIRKIVQEMIAIEPQVVSSVLAIKDEIGEGRDPEIQVELIEQATEDLITGLNNQIDRYLEKIYLPRYVDRSGNRKINFTYHFVGELAEGWKQSFGTRPERADLADLTELIGACLEDFHYPLSETQRESRIWLSDRIRKQLFRN